MGLQMQWIYGIIRIWLLAAVRFETSSVSFLRECVAFSFSISPGLPRKMHTWLSWSLQTPGFHKSFNTSVLPTSFGFLSLHPAFSESFSRLWPNPFSSSKHEIPLSLVTSLIILNSLIFHFLLSTLCHFSCVSILSSVFLSFIPICFRSNFTFLQLCPWDKLLYLMYK